MLTPNSHSNVKTDPLHIQFFKLAGYRFDIHKYLSNVFVQFASSSFYKQDVYDQIFECLRHLELVHASVCERYDYQGGKFTTDPIPPNQRFDQFLDFEFDYYKQDFINLFSYLTKNSEKFREEIEELRLHAVAEVRSLDEQEKALISELGEVIKAKREKANLVLQLTPEFTGGKNDVLDFIDKYIREMQSYGQLLSPELREAGYENVFQAVRNYCRGKDDISPADLYKQIGDLRQEQLDVVNSELFDWFKYLIEWAGKSKKAKESAKRKTA